MNPSLFIWLQRLCAAFGVMLLVFAGWSTKGDRERVQGWLEAAWLHFYEWRDAGVSRHTAFTRLVSSSAAQAIDRVIGPRLFSWHVIPPFVAISLASLIGSQYRFSEDFTVGELLEFAAWSMVFLLPPLASVAWPSARRITDVWLILALALFLKLRLNIFNYWDPVMGQQDWSRAKQFLCFLATVGIAGTLNLALALVFRALLRWYEKSLLLSTIIFTMLLFMLLVVLEGGNILIMESATTFFGSWVGRGVINALFINIVIVPILAGFVALLLIHRAIWPVVLRSPMYAFVDERLITHRKVLASAGLSLVAQGYPQMSAAIKGALGRIGL